jgi:shikimate dehydrogenase
MHTAALAAAGFAIPYGRRDVAPSALPDVLRAFALDGTGGNVTIPHKEAVFAAAVRTTPLAQRVGAVNTFWHEQGVLCGHNTDVAGARAALACLTPHGVAGRCVAVLGAGGSAAAVLVALDEAGCTEIAMWARTPARAEALAARVGVRIRLASSPDAACRDAALVINATPLGMRDALLPVDARALPADAAALDLVYRPEETAWVHACRARGVPAEDGMRMLVEQGAEAFRVWFDAEPSLPAMWNALPPRGVAGG